MGFAIPRAIYSTRCKSQFALIPVYLFYIMSKLSEITFLIHSNVKFDPSDGDTPDDYFFFVLFSVLLNGLFRMYAQFRQVLYQTPPVITLINKIILLQYSQLSCDSGCICLPQVYHRIARKCDFEDLREISVARLRVDIGETFFCKLLVPTLILYYQALPRIWIEAGFFGTHIALKGQELLVQTLFFAFILGCIDIMSSWPFTLYRSTHFDDNTGTPTLFDCLIGDLLMKYPKALQLPKHLFWVVAWSHLQLCPIGIFPALWLAETAFLAVTYEIVETLVEVLALYRLPNNVLKRERCALDLSTLKMYYTSESVAAAKIYIFRNTVALPMSMLMLPFTGDELMSLALRYLALVEGSCIVFWRMLERIQAACLYYLIHSLVSVDALMEGIGLTGAHPVVLRWIIIDYFIYPLLKTFITAIRHYYNYKQEFRADAKTRVLGYDVALEAAIAKLGVHQDRFPIEDGLYELVFQRTPTAVLRIEQLKKCPIRR